MSCIYVTGFEHLDHTNPHSICVWIKLYFLSFAISYCNMKSLYSGLSNFCGGSEVFYILNVVEIRLKALTYFILTCVIDLGNLTI